MKSKAYFNRGLQSARNDYRYSFETGAITLAWPEVDITFNTDHVIAGYFASASLIMSTLNSKLTNGVVAD